MLVSVGRQANVEGIGIDNTEIEVENGYIQTNEHSKQKNHIYMQLVMSSVASIGACCFS